MVLELKNQNTSDTPSTVVKLRVFARASLRRRPVTQRHRLSATGGG